MFQFRLIFLKTLVYLQVLSYLYFFLPRFAAEPPLSARRGGLGLDGGGGGMLDEDPAPLDGGGGCGGGVLPDIPGQASGGRRQLVGARGREGSVP